MFKIFKEKIEERKEKEEDRQRFLKLGMEFLLKKEQKRIKKDLEEMKSEK